MGGKLPKPKSKKAIEKQQLENYFRERIIELGILYPPQPTPINPAIKTMTKDEILEAEMRAKLLELFEKRKQRNQGKK